MYLITKNRDNKKRTNVNKRKKSYKTKGGNPIRIASFEKKYIIN
jgi:hypothetical protein